MRHLNHPASELQVIMGQQIPAQHVLGRVIRVHQYIISAWAWLCHQSTAWDPSTMLAFFLDSTAKDLPGLQKREDGLHATWQAGPTAEAGAGASCCCVRQRHAHTANTDAATQAAAPAQHTCASQFNEQLATDPLTRFCAMKDCDGDMAIGSKTAPDRTCGSVNMVCGPIEVSSCTLVQHQQEGACWEDSAEPAANVTQLPSSIALAWSCSGCEAMEYRLRLRKRRCGKDTLEGRASLSVALRDSMPAASMTHHNQAWSKLCIKSECREGCYPCGTPCLANMRCSKSHLDWHGLNSVPPT
eukprot:668264-Pelagomonas_calceolata.AAC.6